MEVNLNEVLDEMSERGSYEWQIAVLTAQNKKLTAALVKASAALADDDSEGRVEQVGDGV